MVMVSLLAALAPPPAVARAEHPPYLEWTSALPALSASFAPSEAEDCVAGRDQCVAAVIPELDRRLDDLAESCDHNAVFALAYVRTTEGREVSGAGNLVFGMNAHIQNDLPFVLAALGLVKPDGSTRKRDHDRVDALLNRVPDDMVPEVARRFDPTIDHGDVPTHVDAIVKFQSVPAWREVTWRNAERLVSARTAEERAMVAAGIEAYAVSQALLVRRATAYLPVLQSSDARDAFCAEHGG